MSSDDAASAGSGTSVVIAMLALHPGGALSAEVHGLWEWDAEPGWLLIGLAQRLHRVLRLFPLAPEPEQDKPLVGGGQHPWAQPDNSMLVLPASSSILAGFSAQGWLLEHYICPSRQMLVSPGHNQTTACFSGQLQEAILLGLVHKVGCLRIRSALHCRW